MSFNFYSETNFHQTELGPLPQDWHVVRLGDVLIESKTKNKYNESYDVYTVSNINGFVLSDEFFEKQVYSKNLQNYKIVEEDYFAYNPARVNVGSLALFTKKSKGLVSPMYIVFKISEQEKLFHQYLFKLLKSEKYINEIKRISKSRGSVRQILSFGDLCEIHIPLPPLPEQKAIAEVLQTIQEAREKTEAVIKATRELKKSMMKHLFTYGNVTLSDVDKVKLKDTEIGPVPEHWQVVKLGEVILKSQYGISKRGTIKGKYPILRMNNISDGKIKCENLQFVDLTEDEAEKFILQKGDILFNRTNSFELVGKVGIFELEGKYVFASYLIRLKCNNELFSYYLTNYLCFETTQSRLKKLASRGVSQSNISASKLSEFTIPLPPLAEQQAIADILQAIDDKIQKEEARKKAIDNLFKSMLHNLMSGRIRVKI